jgi:hypothetical protein
MLTSCQLIIDNTNSLKALSNDPIFQNEMQQIANQLIEKRESIKNSLSKLK